MKLPYNIKIIPFEHGNVNQKLRGNQRSSYMREETHSMYVRWVDLYTRGYTKHQIGDKVNKSYRTVANAFTALLSLYNVNSMVELVGLLFRKGYLK